MKAKTILLLPILILFIYLGCSPEDSFVPSKEIDTSLFVTVKDPAGKPVAGASIIIGDQIAATEEDGIYFFPQITLTGDDYLRVEKSGYFKGSRRFNVNGSHTEFLRITLLPLMEIGNFAGTESATISIDAKSTLTFTDHSVTRSDGSLYNGNVHVMASPIYSDDPQLSDKMPGTLVGVDESGTKVALGSFGMLAVELQADNGEMLKIASGKTVEMQLAIGDDQLSDAPSTIPLWHFDEDLGYWVQEGEAIRSGNVYVGQLPHFSFWNCDVFFELIDWEGRFVYNDGSPAQNTEVCLTILSLNSTFCGYTNAEGLISGLVGANEIFELNVFNDCGGTIFSKQIGPFIENTASEVISLDYDEYVNSTVSGIALQCNGSAISSGYVRVRTKDSNFMLPILNAEGHFEGTIMYCANEVVSLYVYDLQNELVSLQRSFTPSGDLEVGSITACAETEEFIRYTVKGFSPEYYYYELALENSNFNITRIFSLDSIGVKGRFGFSFDGLTTGEYRAFPVNGNQINLPNGQVAYILTMDVNVTEYGGKGDFIRGDFYGQINRGGNGAGGSGKSDFNGSFVVKNE